MYEILLCFFYKCNLNMELLNNKSVNRLSVVSETYSESCSSGALVVNGGIGVSKNMYVGEEIVTNEIIVNSCAKIEKDLFITGSITVGSMLYSKDKFIFIKKSLIPDNNSLNIGSLSSRWGKVYCEHTDTKYIKSPNCQFIDVDICRSLTVGSKPVLKIDDDNPDTVVVNGSITGVDNGRCTYKISTNNCVSTLSTDNVQFTKFVQCKPQIEHIVDCTNVVNIHSSLLLLYVCSNSALIVCSVDNVEDNSIVKIVLKKVCSNVELRLPNITFIFTESDQYVEFVKINNRLVYTGGNIKPEM